MCVSSNTTNEQHSRDSLGKTITSNIFRCAIAETIISNILSVVQDYFIQIDSFFFYTFQFRNFNSMPNICLVNYIRVLMKQLTFPEILCLFSKIFLFEVNLLDECEYITC